MCSIDEKLDRLRDLRNKKLYGEIKTGEGELKTRISKAIKYLESMSETFGDDLMVTSCEQVIEILEGKR